MASEVEVEAFLAHHGVLGMKWGQRKSQPASSRELVKSANSTFKVARKDIVGLRLNQIWGDSTIDSSKLSDRDSSVKAGKEFYRLTKNSNHDARDVSYVSTNKADRDRYRAVLGGTHPVFGIAARKKQTTTYETTYKVIQDLKSPSEKKRFDAYVELLDKPVITKGKKVMTGREYMKNTTLGLNLDKLESRAIGEKFYTDFAGNQGVKSPLNDAYFQLMRDKGYNAISDDNDRHIVSKDPIILLDTKASVSVLNVKQLSNDEINKAVAAFVPPKEFAGIYAESNKQFEKKPKGGD